MKLRERRYPGSLSDAETARELKNRELARQAAAEGMVLLRNENRLLPLPQGKCIAVYGGGALHTVKGGTGSGSVNNRSNVSVAAGLRNAGFVIGNEAWLKDYEHRYEQARQEWEEQVYANSIPGDFDSFYRAHATTPLQMPRGDRITGDRADTAVYVISRISGEGADRKVKKGDYFLTDTEEEELREVAARYPHVIAVLNVGGIMDLSFADELRIEAVVLMSQAGMEGGNALADILSGRQDPCGHLTDTWGLKYEDYPAGSTFSHNNGNVIEEFYTEGIYVGYRYFDSFRVPVRYPFGYGLSYTDFQIVCEETTLKEGMVSQRVRVKNTGETAGKEAVFLFASCPHGKIQKEKRRLAAFAKTALLQPKEEQVLELSFRISLLESYHSGRSSYLLEAGDYYLFTGCDLEQSRISACLHLDETLVMQKLKPVCPLLDALRERKPSPEAAALWREEMGREADERRVPFLDMKEQALIAKEFDETVLEKSRAKLVRGRSEEDARAEELVGRLSEEEMVSLTCGNPGSAHTEFIGNAAITVPGAAGETSGMLEEKYGIGHMVLADGPAGLRIHRRYEVDPENGSIYSMKPYEMLENRFFGKEFRHEGAEVRYQFCSAIPVGTLLAQTFDRELMERIGDLIGGEMEEYYITVWLAPGMNIHRDPMCGRNFEYYSEDPLVSGMMAAAVTKGVQKHPGIGTCLKHFACNNQEENRRGVSSIVSERALREIYLKGFELAVKEAQPMAIMTSYNKINGVHTANSADLCTAAAREEWGFEGIIMTDWTTTNAGGGSSAAKCVRAGNDLVMPGRYSDLKEITDALHGENDQYLEEEYLRDCARRMIRTILRSSCYEDPGSYTDQKELYTYMK